MNLPNLKEELNILKEVKTVDLTKVVDIIQKFQLLPSSFDVMSVMNKFNDFLDKVNLVLNDLNFNVIGSVVMINQTMVTLNSNIKTITDGSSVLISNFNNLVQSFMDLGEGVTQDYLINIQNNFEIL